MNPLLPAAAPPQHAPRLRPACYTATPTPSGDAAAAQVGDMIDALMRDPSTQQLLLSRMPPHMQRPEVLRAMMANPEVRGRIAALAQQTVRRRERES